MKLKLVTTILAAVMILPMMTLVVQASHHGKGRGSGPVIWVTNHGLYYDAIIAADPLPWKPEISHTFQLLEPTGPSGLQTEFGPGDPGYRGGRWWVDTNPNGEQDPDDHFFSCPLLGPGRESP